MGRVLLLLLLCCSFLFSRSQTISTIAGTKGVYGYTGDGGNASNALLASPFGIAVDQSGNILVSDWSNRVIRKINTSGIITTIAGNGTPGMSGDGGPALNAQLHTVDDIDIDNQGNIYFPEHSSYVIRKIDNNGIITRIAGTGYPPPNGALTGEGGPALQAPLYNPSDIAIDNNSNLYYADPSVGVIRKISPDGIIKTIAGLGFYHQGYSGDGGPATAAKLQVPISVEVDNAGNIYIADLGNHVIRKINTQGIITTFAGNGQDGYSGDGGLAINAKFSRPNGLAIDNAGNIYVADETHHVIRRITPAGIISTVAGTGIEGYSGDGGPAIAAQLTTPTKLAIDNEGRIYISDYFNHTIRMVSNCTDYIPSSVTIRASDLRVCPGTPITFTATPGTTGSAPSFVWQINGSSVSSFGETFTTSTLNDGDIVTCVMLSEDPCVTPANSNPLRISMESGPQINMGPDPAIPPGGSIQLDVSITGNIVSYSWDPPTGLSDPTVLKPVASPATTTTYTLRAISDIGCESTANITVKVIKGLFIPSAFTPNGDGLNDVFRINLGSGIDLKEFSVFNRWGQAVFSTKDASKSWDGKLNGTNVDGGVFVYLIRGIMNGEAVIVRGTVILIR